jgi:hypothetical protein
MSTWWYHMKFADGHNDQCAQHTLLRRYQPTGDQSGRYTTYTIYRCSPTPVLSLEPTAISACSSNDTLHDVCRLSAYSSCSRVQLTQLCYHDTAYVDQHSHPPAEPMPTCFDNVYLRPLAADIATLYIAAFTTHTHTRECTSIHRSVHTDCIVFQSYHSFQCTYLKLVTLTWRIM